MPHRTRVLVVDDDQDTVDTLLALLETDGYNAKGIYSARTIVADVRQFEPAVVVMDIAMPGKSGWDAAREIRGYRTGKRPMLIAVSGQYTKGADRILSELSGFDYYLVKSSDPKVLLKLVASCVTEACAETLVAPSRASTVLTVRPAMGQEEIFRRAFCKHADGSWTCTEAATLYAPIGWIHVVPGSRFYPGTSFMGFDLADWLEARLDDTAERCD